MTIKKTKKPLPLWAKLCISAILPALILIFRPWQMTAQQSLILAALALTLIFWITGWVRKWIASLIILAVFALLGAAPLTKIFQFPLSDNFVMIVFSYLFSQGFANSGLAKKMIRPMLYKWVNTTPRFMVFVSVINLIFIYIIPQPFARIILLAAIINEYLEDACPDARQRDILMFSVYSLYFVSCMALREGDIIMNYSVLSFAGIEATSWEWARAMLVPSLLLMAAQALLLALISRKNLPPGQRAFSRTGEAEKTPLTKREKWILALVLVTVALMATESLHGISSGLVVVVCSAVMFIIKLLKPQDLRAINVELLVFLTASFSVGPAMNESGLAEIVFSRFTPLFPDSFGILYMLVICCITIALHMIMCSCITTNSVAIPGIMAISSGLVSPLAVTLTVYICTFNHYLLPLHNIPLVMGTESRHFSGGTIMRFGVVLTVLVPLFVLFAYRYWWQIIGLI